MVGLELGFDKYKLIIREKGRVIEVAEGLSSQLKGFKASEVYISFTCPRLVGKFYNKKVGKKEIESEFGTHFEYRIAGFKTGKNTGYFFGGVEKATFLSVMDFLKSLRISKIVRLNFTPFVLLDVLSFLSVPSKVKDCLALAFHDKFIYYVICKDGQPQLVSSFESENWMDFVSDLVKTFFEEGLNTVFLTGEYPETAVSELKAITDDGDVNIFNPFIEFTIATPREFKQTAFYSALGVTL